LNASHTRQDNDTIAAISTPLGEGGIGVVRISGPEAIAFSDSLFRPFKGEIPSLCKSHTVHYGSIRHPASGETADEVLLTVMRSPNTYTAEDIVEVSCHGGRMSLKKVLELYLDAGARIAEPGEFTKRAFLNGRVDLSQAEAVLDIIRSETSRAQAQALDQLKGALSARVRDIREDIIGILSSLEVSIDFSDQDLEEPVLCATSAAVARAARSIRKMLDTADRGIILRTGAGVVICGRPNVGKSSLMNALLRHDRVIVTPIAGTTRDVIEESINIGGVKIKLSDTAGIIETRDRVEMEGIKRSREKLASSDAVIFMLDSSSPLSDRDMDIYGALKDKKTVVVLNKTDLAGGLKESDVKKALGVEEVIPVSVLKKIGLEEVEDAIIKTLTGGFDITPESAMVANLRHKECLEKSYRALARCEELLKCSYNPELLASDLNEAAHNLALITGQAVEDDILDRIFSEFCIGK
jgi:tRNA modification GTPase